ncbi:MAG: alanine dehydrogenase [Saprospiraceae bacterium]|nr:alanine dehydrogenase [Saprospiraceae bacterium]
MTDPKRLKSQELLSMGHWETKAEVLDVAKNQKKLFIGIPAESTLQENRVALIPSSVATLVGNGHRVVVETGAGENSNFSDNAYSEVGAEIVHSREEVFNADCLIKVAPPTLDEIELLHPNQMLISPLHLPYLTENYLIRLKQKRVIALAMEYLQDRDGSFPVVRIMSEIAGINAILTAAELLSTTGGGNGVLLGGISGVPPARVVILGAGVLAEYATMSALGLGATVSIFDNNIYKLMRLQNRLGRKLYTSVLNPVYLEQELVQADVAIGAIHSKLGRTPIVVSEDLVNKMKPGAVIVDVSIDQGGCFATSEVTSHERPTFKKHDVIHYCVPNLSSKVSRTASAAISNILTPILLKAGETTSIEQLFFHQQGLRHGIYTYKGCLTNEYLAQRFQIKYTDLDLLLTANI